jgi:rSAM/selenodomain-associated transferase 2
MNAGANAARGDVLWFLHADTLVSPAALAALPGALAQSGGDWGRFDVQLTGSHPLLRLVEWSMNLRSRWTAIATGDQGIFVRRGLFEQVGGFADIPLMEDIALSRRLKRHSPPLRLRARLYTSSRRWERNGIVRTIVLMWRLRFAYWRGVPPQRLAERYRQG